MAERMLRNKWQVRVAALVIFVLGFVAGAAGNEFYRGWAHRRASPETRSERTGARACS